MNDKELLKLAYTIAWKLSNWRNRDKALDAVLKIKIRDTSNFKQVCSYIIQRIKKELRRKKKSIKTVSMEDVELIVVDYPPVDLPLTNTELEIVLHTSEGYTISEIAEKLRLSERTISRIKAAIKERLKNVLHD